MTYEHQVAMRAIARKQLEDLRHTVAEMTTEMDLPERLELSGWVCEGQRLLFGEEPPPGQLPPNVRPIRKMATPKFKRRDLLPDDGPGGAA